MYLDFYHYAIGTLPLESGEVSHAATCGAIPGCLVFPQD